jgi:hypothetical protein
VHRLSRIALLIALSAIAGCAAKEVLQPLPNSSVAPDGVDFSGTWVMRDDESDGQRSINRAVSQVGGSSVNSSSKSGSKNGRVQVFLETGSQLKIIQTPDGFFVSLDRSVVEEFRFGENRIINIGEIEAQRVSGWDGPVYTVITLDSNGMKMIDRFWLGDNIDVLLREITFLGRNNEQATVNQFFDRYVR